MDWTDEYREIVDFYYWEPQHIGRAKGEKRFDNADDMHTHINKLEVSLNHILNIFFSLYSLYKLDCFDADKSHTMMSSRRLELIDQGQKRKTQPDLFFQGVDKNIAIELKTGSKSNLEQVIKYIKFNKIVPGSAGKKFELVFLTPHSVLSKVFKEKYQTVQEIYDQIDNLGFDVPKISIISFDDFYKSLKKIPPQNEIENRLISGLISYFNKRIDILVGDSKPRKFIWTDDDIILDNHCTNQHKVV